MLYEVITIDSYYLASSVYERAATVSGVYRRICLQHLFSIDLDDAGENPGGYHMANSQGASDCK